MSTLLHSKFFVPRNLREIIFTSSSLLICKEGNGKNSQRYCIQNSVSPETVERLSSHLQVYQGRRTFNFDPSTEAMFFFSSCSSNNEKKKFVEDENEDAIKRKPDSKGKQKVMEDDKSVLKGTYDVFLSFRGEDTRKGFISHLYRALVYRGIRTFRDDDRLERGKNIAPELLNAIENSTIAIVVFSKNYANSSWCLDELVKIVEWHPRNIVYPVFYDVDPSDVRKQKNEVAEALAKLGTIDNSRMKKWREALKMAASFSGLDVPNTANGDELECIQRIVDDVDGKLGRGIPITSKNVVGMEHRVSKVLQMLRVGECDEVVMVGIWGIGGAGKTTIAKATFDKLYHSFKDGSCFLKIPIGESSENDLIDFQKTLLRTILNSESEYMHIIDVEHGKNMIRERLRSKKVLIVLDNVHHRDQLDALAPVNKTLFDPDTEFNTSFGPGSRVIITTRDNKFLDKVDEDNRYKVDLLSDSEAMQLFHWHAFQTTKTDEIFANLSHEFVEYAKGLPLALKVLGSHLRGLNWEEWSTEIDILQKFLNKDILSVLKISYDGLNEIDKSIFLDVACFFRGWDANKVKQIHERGITILERKSLVYVDRKGHIEMHEIQEMGRNIVQKDHPGSRLWKEDEIFKVLSASVECDALEAVVLRLKRSPVVVSNEAIKRMKRIRLLIIRCYFWNSDEMPVRYLDEAPPECLSNELQWLDWDRYTWDSLPETFGGTKLVALQMRGSNIIRFSTGRGQNFEKLRLLDLSMSEELKQTPDFSQIPCLEKLNLMNCENLEEIHSSFGVHKKLQWVNLSGCRRLRRLPERLQMAALEYLNLSQCWELETFPEIEGNMTALKALDVSFTGIKRLPDSVKNLNVPRGYRINANIDHYILLNDEFSLSSTFETDVKEYGYGSTMDWEPLIR